MTPPNEAVSQSFVVTSICSLLCILHLDSSWWNIFGYTTYCWFCNTQYYYSIVCVHAIFRWRKIKKLCGCENLCVCGFYYLHHLSLKGPFLISAWRKLTKKRNKPFDRSDTSGSSTATENPSCPAGERRNCSIFIENQGNVFGDLTEAQRSTKFPSLKPWRYCLLKFVCVCVW